MKKLLAVAALLAATSATAYAAGGDVIGTPGDSNCVGQTTAWVAQIIKNADLDPVEYGRGVAGYAQFFSGGDVKELKAAIQAYCAL